MRLVSSPIQADIEAISAIGDVPGLVKAMATLYRASISMPFGFYIYPDLKDSENYAAYFGQSGLTMPNRDYYLEKDNENFAKAREALPAYIHDMLVIAGYDDAQAEQGAAAVYAIEEKIAEAQWDSVTNRDPQKAYNPHTREQLDELAGNLNWPQLAAIQGVDGEEKLIIRQPSYFAALNELITDIPVERLARLPDLPTAGWLRLSPRSENGRCAFCLPQPHTEWSAGRTTPLEARHQPGQQFDG